MIILTLKWFRLIRPIAMAFFTKLSPKTEATLTRKKAGRRCRRQIQSKNIIDAKEEIGSAVERVDAVDAIEVAVDAGVEVAVEASVDEDSGL